MQIRKLLNSLGTEKILKQGHGTDQMMTFEVEKKSQDPPCLTSLCNLQTCHSVSGPSGLCGLFGFSTL